MSKTTKALAILGVVAGLGVASLPLSSYAATEIKGEGTPLTAKGAVPIELEIEETLSMYIADGSDADIEKVSLTSTNGADYTADPINIKVDSKNAAGYYLTMHGSYEVDGKSYTATSLYNAAGTEITTGTDFTDTTAASHWGYKVQKGAAGSPLDSAWNSVAAADNAATIDSLGAAGSQTTQVKFGAHVIPGQESGTYNGEVTFTATAGAKS